MKNYLLICTCTHLHVGVKYDGVGAPVTWGRIWPQGPKNK